MKNGNSTYLDTGIQKEFQSIFQQLYCSEDVRLEAFIGFDDNLVTSRNEINTDLVDKTHEKAIWYLLPIKREAGVEDESKSEGYDKDKDENQAMAPSQGLQHLDDLLLFKHNWQTTTFFRFLALKSPSL